MRTRWAVVLLVVTVLAGRGTGSGAEARTSSVQGLRTDSDQRGLVAAYVGGSCDGPARLAVDESADRIELSIVIEPDPSGARSCDAVGHGRTVRARLPAAIGSRSIWDGQVRQLPFAGSRLVVPTDLPTGFAAIQE